MGVKETLRSNEGVHLQQALDHHSAVILPLAPRMKREARGSELKKVRRDGKGRIGPVLGQEEEMKEVEKEQKNKKRKLERNRIRPEMNRVASLTVCRMSRGYPFFLHDLTSPLSGRSPFCQLRMGEDVAKSLDLKHQVRTT